MKAIVRINESDMPWSEYADTAREGPAPIRFKALTAHAPDVPSIVFIEYAPGHTDPVHSHDTDEVFVVVAGELWLEGLAGASGPGSIVFIPRDTEYAVRGGDEGVRYFRVVVVS